jgi:SAM-dependent methyltransferase
MTAEKGLPSIHTLSALRQRAARIQAKGKHEPTDETTTRLSGFASQSPTSSASWTRPWTWFSKTNASNCAGNESGGRSTAATIGAQFLDRCRSGRTEAGQPLSKYPPRSFDTVIDAFGLCSHEDPVLVLQEASRVCKPDGRILLLEHGRAHTGFFFDWLNTSLDRCAMLPMHVPVAGH